MSIARISRPRRIVIRRVDIRVARTLMWYTATATAAGHERWIVGIIIAGAFRAGAGSGGKSTTAIGWIEVRLWNMKSLVACGEWGRGGRGGGDVDRLLTDGREDADGRARRHRLARCLRIMNKWRLWCSGTGRGEDKKFIHRLKVRMAIRRSSWFCLWMGTSLVTVGYWYSWMVSPSH